jgi:hypothetical protein
MTSCFSAALDILFFACDLQQGKFPQLHWKQRHPIFGWFVDGTLHSSQSLTLLYYGWGFFHLMP